MSSLSKIVAGVLLVAGIVLAFVAWRLASAPTTPPASVTPVSYTHLTLPTILLV